MKKFTFLVIILILSLYLYGKYIEVNLLGINEYTIENALVPDSFADLKIVHFSDLLYEKDLDQEKLEKLVTLINKEEADIIIFSGDLLKNGNTYTNEDYEFIKEKLKNMNANLYKYAVIGDSDQADLENYKDILYEAEFKLLDNQNMLLFYKDNTPINIIGLTNTNNIEELLKTDIPYEYSIAIIHKPDNISTLKEHNINLVLSGHSLGGMINLPYYGGVIKKDGAEKYINDYYNEDGTKMFISNGLGYDKFNYRLFNKPSINIYRFSK